MKLPQFDKFDGPCRAELNAQRVASAQITFGKNIFSLVFHNHIIGAGIETFSAPFAFDRVNDPCACFGVKGEGLVSAGKVTVSHIALATDIGHDLKFGQGIKRIGRGVYSAESRLAYVVMA